MSPEHRPLNGFLALGDGDRSYREQYGTKSKKEEYGKKKEVAKGEEINPFKVYDMVAPYGYGDPGRQKNLMEVHEKYLNLLARTEPLLNKYRLRSLERKLIDYASYAKLKKEVDNPIGARASVLRDFYRYEKSVKRDAFWYGCKRAGPWYGFPIVSTITKPFRTLWNGEKYRKDIFRYGEELAKDIGQLSEAVAAQSSPASTSKTVPAGKVPATTANPNTVMVPMTKEQLEDYRNYLNFRNFLNSQKIQAAGGATA